MHMLFEALRDGRVLMRTEEESCIYPTEILLMLLAAGYRFRLNGRAWRPNKPEKQQPIQATASKGRRRTK